MDIRLTISMAYFIEPRSTRSGSLVRITSALIQPKILMTLLFDILLVLPHIIDSLVRLQGDFFLGHIRQPFLHLNVLKSAYLLLHRSDSQVLEVGLIAGKFET